MELESKCLNCGLVCEQQVADTSDRIRCTVCGSKTRVFEASFRASLEFHAGLRLKLTGIGRKRPVVELFVGEEFFVREQRWVNKERRIDREANRYFEKLVDPNDGSVLHLCDEPLDTHCGHGKAKLQIDGEKKGNSMTNAERFPGLQPQDSKCQTADDTGDEMHQEF